MNRLGGSAYSSQYKSIVVLPSNGGKSVTKSWEMYDQGCSETGRGCRRPARLCCGHLALGTNRANSLMSDLRIAV